MSDPKPARTAYAEAAKIGGENWPFVEGIGDADAARSKLAVYILENQDRDMSSAELFAYARSIGLHASEGEATDAYSAFAASYTAARRGIDDQAKKDGEAALEALAELERSVFAA